MAPVVITHKLADFLEGGQSMLVATRSASLEPAIVRAFGAEVEPDRAHVVVFVPEAVAAETLENLRGSPRIAITFARTHDHRTFQIKGDCVDIAPTSDTQRSIVESYRSAFAGQLEIVGVPRRLSMRLQAWPSVALRVFVTDVFAQTPGPGSGDRWHPFSDALESGRGDSRETLG